MKQLTWVAAVAALAIVAWLGSQTRAPEEDPSIPDEGVFATIAPFNSYGVVHDADNVEAMRPRVMGTAGSSLPGTTWPRRPATRCSGPGATPSTRG